MPTRAVDLLRSAVPALPESVFEARMRMLGLGLGTSLAKRLRANGPVNAANVRHYDTMVRDNIDYMVGGFSGPVGKRRARGRT